MNDTTIDLDGHEIELSHTDKILFPETGLTKWDLIDFYRRVAKTALPYYLNRPLTMQRFPDGIGQHGFFQKHTPSYFPDWIARHQLPKEDGTVSYVVANKPATLVYLANQACITPHLGLARLDQPDRPDRLIFDLDPSDRDFDKVRSVAKHIKKLLDELKLPSFVMTTGSRGLHIIVPLNRSARFDAVRGFAQALARRLSEQHPQEITVEHRKKSRGSRVFVDTLRNAYGQTAVAPYAVRAIEGAPVATPLRWDELNDGNLDAQRYTMKNLFRRLGQIKNPWSAMDHRASDIGGACKTLF